MSKNMRTASGKTATHKMIVDGEPVVIVSEQAEGRAEGFFVVEGANGKFVAHKYDLTLVVEDAPQARPTPGLGYATR